jgi:hypothetical protein
VLPYAIADMAEFLGNAGALSASTYHAVTACSVADHKGRLARLHADILAPTATPSPTSTPSTARVAPFHWGHACHQQSEAHA